MTPDFPDYGDPAETRGSPDYEHEMAEVYQTLVDDGHVTPHQNQKVDLSLVEAFLALRGAKTTDGFVLLTRLQDDLDAEGRAEVTLDFVRRMDRGMMELATETYASGLMEDESDPFSRGIGLVLAHRYREAIAAFNKAIESDDCGPLVYWHRGRAFQRVGSHRLAIPDFDRYLASGLPWRHPTTFVWRAGSFLAEGRPAEAVESLAGAVADLNADPNVGKLLAVRSTGEPTPQLNLGDGAAITQEEEELFSCQQVIANELRCVTAAVRQIDALANLPADLRPALAKIQSDLASLRERLGL
jgi:tetratricopeptide (TPR) repeat protein